MNSIISNYKILLYELKRNIKLKFGNRCSKYDAVCPCCRVWEAYEILEQLYESEVLHDKRISKEYQKKRNLIGLKKRIYQTGVPYEKRK